AIADGECTSVGAAAGAPQFTMTAALQVAPFPVPHFGQAGIEQLLGPVCSARAPLLPGQADVADVTFPGLDPSFLGDLCLFLASLPLVCFFLLLEFDLCLHPVGLALAFLAAEFRAVFERLPG